MFESVASAGTLVATAFEVAGYHYQAYLLDVLTQPFTGSIGALIYTIAIVAALGTAAISGQYKLAGWFLLGPVLFFSVILTRTDSTVPNWKFANKEQKYEKSQTNELSEAELLNNAVGSVADDIDATNRETASVSALFAGYDIFISSIVQQLIKVITFVRNDENINAKFLLRAEMHAMLNTEISSDQYFNDLMHTAFFSECATALNKAIAVIDPLNPLGQTPTERESQLRDQLSGRNVTLNDDALLYLASLRLDIGSGGADTLWKGPAQGQSMGDWMAEVKNRGRSFNPIVADGERLRPYEQRMSQLEQERKKLKAETQGGIFNCGDIWKLVYSGLHIVADSVVDKAGKIGRRSGLPEDELYGELLRIEGFTLDGGEPNTIEVFKLNKLREVVARNIFNNHLSDASNLYPSFLSRLGQSGRDVDSVATQSLSDMKGSYRHIRKGEEWAKKSEAFSYAQNLPYYQGVSLYFLAIMFPFFALMLIFPGKHVAFLQWFVLWLWVKSWDVGFAVVMCLDDIFFELMVESRLAENGQPTPFDIDLDAAIRSLESIDPTFGPTIYYTIIGTALAAIPSITSQLIKSALSGGLGLIASGGSVQGAMNSQGSYVGSGATATSGQHAATNLRAQTNSAGMSMFQNRMEQVRQGGEGSAPLGYMPLVAEDRRVGEIVSAGLNKLDALGEGLSLAQGYFSARAQGVTPAAISKITNASDSRDSKMIGFFYATGNKPDAISTSDWQNNFLPIIEETKKGLLELRQAELELRRAWFETDTFYNPYSQELSGMTGLYGVMSLPQIKEYSDADKEIEKRLTELDLAGRTALVAKNAADVD